MRPVVSLTTAFVSFRTIATGHYVRTDESMRELEGEAAADVVSRNSSDSQKNPRLLMGVDDSKDQSYFLCMTKVQADRLRTPLLLLI